MFMCSNSVYRNHTHTLTTFVLRLRPKIKDPCLLSQHISTDVDIDLHDYFTSLGTLKLTLSDLAGPLMILTQGGSCALFDAINNLHASRSETALLLGVQESDLLAHTPHSLGLVTILEPQNVHTNTVLVKGGSYNPNGNQQSNIISFPRAFEVGEYGRLSALERIDYHHYLASPTNTELEDAKHHELHELSNTQAYRTLILFERRGEQCIIFDQGHRPMPKLLAERGTLEAHDLFCGSAQDSADQKASRDCSQLSSNKTSDPGHQQRLHTGGHTLVNETPTPKECNNDSTDTGQPDLEDEPFEMDPEIWDFLLDEQLQYPDFWLSRNS